MPNKSYFEILGSKGKFNFKIATNCRNAQPMAVLHSLRWSLLCYRRKFSSPGCSGQGGQTLLKAPVPPIIVSYIAFRELHSHNL